MTSGTGLAKALQAQYGSAINMNADVAITATGPEAHGMSVNGYGSSNAMQDGTINVNGSTTMNVASEAENGTAVGLYIDNSNVGKARIVVNDADVKANGPNAFGIQAKNKGDVTITGDVKAAATGANAVGASLENSTLALTEGASAEVTGEKTGIFMDTDSSLNAAKATVTTNTIGSAGATTLTNGAVLGVALRRHSAGARPRAVRSSSARGRSRSANSRAPTRPCYSTTLQPTSRSRTVQRILTA